MIQGLNCMTFAQYEGFCFDLDGTVWVGSRALPDAVAVLRLIKRSGRHLVFITNNSMEPPGRLARRLSRMGFDVDPGQVLSAAAIAGEVVLQKMGPSRILLLGSPALAEILSSSGHRVTLARSGTEGHEVDCLVVGRAPGLTYRSLNQACRALDRGASLVAVNMDKSMPGPQGRLVVKPGALVAALQAVVNTEPLVIGKPAPYLFKMALSQMGVTAEKAVMVGDNPATDLVGAHRAGMDSILVNPGPVSADVRPVCQLPSMTALRSALERGG